MHMYVASFNSIPTAITERPAIFGKALIKMQVVLFFYLGLHIYEQQLTSQLINVHACTHQMQYLRKSKWYF